MTLPPLLILTDRSQLPAGRSLTDTIAACVAAGATHVVLREMDLPLGRRAALAASLAQSGASVIAAHTHLPGAIGVHLPAGAPAVHGRFGRSCHSAAAAAAAAAEGAQYATLSPFASTASKPGYGPPLAPGEFVPAPLPVYALGGISVDNASAALAAGASGLAVMGAVMRADDPGAVVAALLRTTA